ncbi:tetratricopeptide repeat protein [Candidatus Dependentiae bacterium]|nr:tetratricopeptide repeat protein [Candidatus Dependentiae bacterium]MBU4387217.1 tetratricopeptide repeat protein [Candidatus Dependentiae bacterium]MCG2756005.1 tetratricopeptide repeat protein [Candidatus Dependentiae bacterium]
MSTKISLTQKIFTPIILSIITFLFYLSTLKFPFIYDDMPTIIENFHIIKGNFLHGIFFAYSRWISRFLHSVIYKFYGENPTAFRIFNLTLHITIGIIIFFILIKLLSNLNQDSFLKKNCYLISTFSSLLFLLHPAQTQTVTYITQMSLEGLVLFFVVLTAILFIYAAYQKNKYLKYFLYFLAIISAIFSAGTKEIVITLPFLILLIDISFIAQGNLKNLKHRIPVHALIFISVFGTLYQLGFKPVQFSTQIIKNPISNNRGNILTESHGQKIESGNYFISQFKVLLHYMRIYVIPKPLAFDYGYVLTKNIYQPDFIYPFIAIVLIILLALIAFIKNQANFFSFGIAWFFIGVLPRASFIPSTELVCDYKTYISSFGIIFLLAVILFYLLEKAASYIKNFVIFEKHIVHYTLLFFLIIISGFSSKFQNKIWQNELSYWQHAVKNAPNKANLWNNYGVALSDAKRIDEAIEVYKKACVIDPNYAEPIINLAFHYQAKNQYDLAMEQYAKAINMSEFHPEMYLNLGSLHLIKKNYKEAEICFDLALKHRPYYSRAHFNKGFMYEQQNMLELAFDSYEKALIGNYQTLQFYYQHAKMALKLNKLDEAIKSFETIKAQDSNFLDTLTQLANIYYLKRDYKNATNNFELIYKKDTNNLVAAYNLAQALINLRDFKTALPLFKQCEHDVQTFPYAKLHIAKCLIETNNKQESLKVLNDLISNPPHLGVKNDAVGLLKEIAV